ncbi:hypothetical protein ATCV1_z470L [Acanthocystis turfacea chlorella virus 1]|uniref:Uncharacterized protein z470L n=1 Tax=Chlorovirus heliozoae TaxID=322019 RepID=A7K980_9PHYC|nr:hypothetical protein ATCV1_z470L [Acanthocystis turfacea chlorella virus 1]ABT16604.1 hypothetical protein ATCV1_z470L [Acanthocystis turfacea chlorella virus 1]
MDIMFWSIEGSTPPIMFEIIVGSMPMDLVSAPMSMFCMLDRSICCTRCMTSPKRVPISSSPFCIFSENSWARVSMPSISSLGVLSRAVASMDSVEPYAHMDSLVVSETLFHRAFASIPGMITVSNRASSLAMMRSRFSPKVSRKNFLGLREPKFFTQSVIAFSSGKTPESSCTNSRARVLKFSSICFKVHLFCRNFTYMCVCF